MYLEKLLFLVLQSLWQIFLYFSFKTNSKKLTNLIRSEKQVAVKYYSVPIINISKFVLSNKEEQQLILGLKSSFVDKNKNKKKVISN